MRWRDVLLGLGLALLLAGPAIGRGELVGSPRAETYGHAWVQAWTAEQWPAWPTGTDLALGTKDRHVIDPLPTWIAGAIAVVDDGLSRGLPFGFVRGLSGVQRPLATPALTFAWNTLVIGWIALAAMGGAALGRATKLSPTFVAVGCVMSPIWRGSLWSGLTEDGAVGVLLLAIAFLWSATDATGTGRRALAAGFLLGLLAWCGLYLAWFGAATAVGIGLWRLAGGPARVAAAKRLGVAAILAAVIAMPALLPFRTRLSGVGHRSGTPAVQVEPLWRVNPWRAADVASFLAPSGEQPLGDAFVREHPVWIGYPTLALAAVGAGPLTAPVVAMAAWSVGQHPSLGGTPLSCGNPVADALDRLPFASLFNHHARLWILGQIGCVLLAGHGIRRIQRRFPVAGPLLVPLALLGTLADAACLGPGPLVLPGTSSATPSVYDLLADLPPGPIAVVGATGPGVHPQQLYFDQRAHGRKLLANPDRPEEPNLKQLPPGTLVVALGDFGSINIENARAAFGEPVAEDASGGVWLCCGVLAPVQP